MDFSVDPTRRPPHTLNTHDTPLDTCNTAHTHTPAACTSSIMALSRWFGISVWLGSG